MRSGEDNGPANTFPSRFFRDNRSINTRHLKDGSQDATVIDNSFEHAVQERRVAL